MVAIVSAPTNLGLRPPERGGVPGTAKAPEALREAGLHRRLHAGGEVDAGVVLPGRYVDDDGRRPAGSVRNQAAMQPNSPRLTGSGRISTPRASRTSGTVTRMRSLRRCAR